MGKYNIYRFIYINEFVQEYNRTISQPMHHIPAQPNAFQRMSIVKLSTWRKEGKVGQQPKK